jgi:hypothetical protein
MTSFSLITGPRAAGARDPVIQIAARLVRVTLDARVEPVHEGRLLGHPSPARGEENSVVRRDSSSTRGEGKKASMAERR